MSDILKRAARTFLHSLGAISAFRCFNRSATRILMYHHFPPNTDNLTRQCESIRRLYNPVALRDVARSLTTGEPLPANSVAVTVDDGYRSFFTNAYPVFRAFKIPVTVFLVSDFLNGKAWLWWDVLDYAIHHTRRTSLVIGDRIFQLTDGVCETICELLKTFPHEERLRVAKEVIDALEVALPSEPPSKYAPLSWSEVRQLVREGVEFGGHTKTHPILSRISDPETLREEIADSKSRIENELGEPVVHFCYPNGRHGDFTDETIELVRAAGFQTAVTAEPGMNFPGAPPFLLKRLGVEPDTPVPYFRELLAGLRLQ